MAEDIRGNPHKKTEKPKSYGICPTKAPLWLDKTARDFWKRIAPSLAQEGILNPVTYDLLATGAQAYSNYRLASDMLAKEGRVVTSPSGVVKASPWLTVENKAFEQLCRVVKELKIAGPVAPVDDELDKFLEDTDKFFSDAQKMLDTL